VPRSGESAGALLVCTLATPLSLALKRAETQLPTPSAPIRAMPLLEPRRIGGGDDEAEEDVAQRIDRDRRVDEDAGVVGAGAAA
jgi:hypothetical protein